MTMLAAMESLAGAGLVGAVPSDVFRSVVVPRATTGRVRLGPVLPVTPMLVWVALVVLGHGLLLHALGAGLKPAPNLSDALHAGGAAFPTSGLNGQETVSAGVRLLTVVAGLSGLAVITLVAISGSSAAAA